jgi:excinuclease ABC subunit A
VQFPLAALVCVTGVSGSGKSSLVYDTLGRALVRRLGGTAPKPGPHTSLRGASGIDKVIDIDQSPIGRTPRSNAATYTGAFDEIRKVFAATREARQRGYRASRFSFNVRGGGGCERCQGQGVMRIEMNFLPDLYVPCPECRGARFNPQTLAVRFRGQSIADVLAMSVDDALDFFDAVPGIHRPLASLHDVGLGYLSLGQPSTTLSGGEAQRVKLAAELAQTVAGTLRRAEAEPSFPRRREPSEEASAQSRVESPESRARKTSFPRRRESSTVAGTLRRADRSTLYLLDEPTTGLHFDDVKRLLSVLGRLVDRGNTVIVIEHNLDVIKTADWLLDLGPEGGQEGGFLVAAGTPEEVAALENNHTGRFLRAALSAASN